MLNSLQNKPGFYSGLGDRLLVRRRTPLGLQRKAAQVPAAEAGRSAAASPQRGPPPAGGLCVQPSCPVAAALPSRLHQALHCVTGSSGLCGHSRAAVLDAPAGMDTGRVDGDGWL